MSFQLSSILLRLWEQIPVGLSRLTGPPLLEATPPETALWHWRPWNVRAPPAPRSWQWSLAAWATTGNPENSRISRVKSARKGSFMGEIWIYNLHGDSLEYMTGQTSIYWLNKKEWWFRISKTLKRGIKFGLTCFLMSSQDWQKPDCYGCVKRSTVAQTRGALFHPTVSKVIVPLVNNHKLQYPILRQTQYDKRSRPCHLCVLFSWIGAGSRLCSPPLLPKSNDFTMICAR